jgi:sigma-B regulation protein RsbU (phosphoserine phosphatase)
MNDEKNTERPLRILHVEDSPMDAEIIRERLIDAGFSLQMDWAANKREFTTFLQRGGYDLILADYRLPAFDGAAALRMTKSFCPGVPFICVSGAIGEEKAVELLKQGATDYVLKDRLYRLPLAVQRALDEVREQK